jgi:DNA polymerase-3 subunit epsilon
MFKNLILRRPLVVLDLETTGLDSQKDRIVELCALKTHPDGHTGEMISRVNPGIPIPPETSAIHGITDADVADAPHFADVAANVLHFLDGCDLCGFNLKRFDLRLLYNEFRRVGLHFSLEGRAIIDALEIFYHYERRDLSAAVRFYLGREHTPRPRGAQADSLATAEVLDAMVARYADLPRDAAGIHQLFKDPNAVDSSGCFVRIDGELRFAFGKYRGQPLHVIARTRPDYLEWMLTQDFFDDAKALVKQALARP